MSCHPSVILSPSRPAQDGGGHTILNPPLPAALPLPPCSSSGILPSCPRAPPMTPPSPWAAPPLWNQKPKHKPQLQKPELCLVLRRTSTTSKHHCHSLSKNKATFISRYSFAEDLLDLRNFHHAPQVLKTIAKRSKKLHLKKGI